MKSEREDVSDWLAHSARTVSALSPYIPYGNHTETDTQTTPNQTTQQRGKFERGGSERRATVTLQAKGS